MPGDRLREHGLTARPDILASADASSGELAIEEATPHIEREDAHIGHANAEVVACAHAREGRERTDRFPHRAGTDRGPRRCGPATRRSFGVPADEGARPHPSHDEPFGELPGRRQPLAWA